MTAKGNMLPLVRKAFSDASRVLVVSHSRPDGDAIGSLLGLGLALEAAGKFVQMALVDDIPPHFRNLPGAERITKTFVEPAGLIVVVDSADLQRTGGILGGASPDVNIDHHVTNSAFARLNLVDSQAAATAEILAGSLPALGLEISAPVAANLLTGVIADTLGFRTSSVTAQVLRTAADLVDAGAELPALYRQALMQRSFAAGRYWGAGLSRLEQGDGLVWAALTLADRNRCGYPGADDADLINVVSSIDGARVALIFVEQPNQRVKVSWRAQPGLDVSAIAASFGGGGHRAAAGAEIDGAMEQVQRRVLETTLKAVQDAALVW